METSKYKRDELTAMARRCVRDEAKETGRPLRYTGWLVEVSNHGARLMVRYREAIAGGSNWGALFVVL